jgi:hypothetical protein
MLAFVVLASAAILASPTPVEPRHETLPQPRVISGVPCADYARYEGERLVACRASRDVTLRSGTIPARSPIFLGATGTIARAFLSRDTVLQGHSCRGGPGKWETSFHASGALARCWLAGPETIDGVPCAAGGVIADVRSGDSSTAFREDGRLESCLLAADAVIDGFQRRRGERAEGPR